MGLPKLRHPGLSLPNHPLGSRIAWPGPQQAQSCQPLCMPGMVLHSGFRGEPAWSWPSSGRWKGKLERNTTSSMVMMTLMRKMWGPKGTLIGTLSCGCPVGRPSEDMAFHCRAEKWKWVSPSKAMVLLPEEAARTNAQAQGGAGAAGGGASGGGVLGG